jgi:hypothetical protein
VLQMAEPSPYFLKPLSLPKPSLGFGRSIWFRNCWITLCHRQWHDSGDMSADFLAATCRHSLRILIPNISHAIYY